jgi:hypothetical protein
MFPKGGRIPSGKNPLEQLTVRLEISMSDSISGLCQEHIARRRRESLRRTFRPADIRLLFIGEAPPVSGRFFYQRDSGLYRAMRDAFRIVDASIDDENFLEAFHEAGCYLVDLCPEPVDHLDSKARRAACSTSEALLAGIVAQLQPAMIGTVVRSIEDNVARSAARSGWHGPFLHLPYPGRWSRHRDRFVEALVPAIGSLILKKT